MVKKMDDYYPLLDNLLGAYLNQDFDYICESDTIEGAVDYYINDTPRGILVELMNEFDAFSKRHPHDPDSAFEELFHPDIVIDDVQFFFDMFKSKIVTSGKL